MKETFTIFQKDKIDMSIFKNTKTPEPFRVIRTTFELLDLKIEIKMVFNYIQTQITSSNCKSQIH